jgi:serine-type D-Ala-D-Ala carboxypeptidase/endopeptidase (penicillin-binding protein 4)
MRSALAPRRTAGISDGERGVGKRLIMQGLSRRAMLAGLLSAAARPALADAPTTSLFPVPRGGRPREAVAAARQLIAEARLTGVVTYVVADADTGQVIESDGAAVPVPPASVTKMVTSLYALEHLGPDYRFATRVLATGPLVDGKVSGDLVLAGGGDPTFDTDRMADLVARLAAAGVKGVTGRFIICAGALPYLPVIDPLQPDYVGYNPAVAGLNLNFNRVHFSWRRQGDGYALDMDARGARLIPPVRMATMDVVDREGPLFEYAFADDRDRWSVARGALGREGSRWMPVRHPARYAAEVFGWLAAAQGIMLPAPEFSDVVPQARVLVQDVAGPLTDVLADMLLYSTNLTAEAVGLTASRRPTLAHSAAAMSIWAKAALGMTSQFGDHSGLGSTSHTTAGDMVRALVGAKGLARGALLPGILRDVGMKDDRGRVIEGHPVQVRAKSGTLNFVSGLAGFISPPGGRRLAFAVYAADVPRRDALSEAEREDPEGGEAWTKRARVLHGRLIARWAGLYG